MPTTAETLLAALAPRSGLEDLGPPLQVGELPATPLQGFLPASQNARAAPAALSALPPPTPSAYAPTSAPAGGRGLQLPGGGGLGGFLKSPEGVAFLLAAAQAVRKGKGSIPGRIADALTGGLGGIAAVSEAQRQRLEAERKADLEERKVKVQERGVGEQEASGEFERGRKQEEIERRNKEDERLRQQRLENEAAENAALNKYRYDELRTRAGIANKQHTMQQQELDQRIVAGAGKAYEQYTLGVPLGQPVLPYEEFVGRYLESYQQTMSPEAYNAAQDMVSEKARIKRDWYAGNLERDRKNGVIRDRAEYEAAFEEFWMKKKMEQALVQGAPTKAAPTSIDEGSTTRLEAPVTTREAAVKRIKALAKKGDERSVYEAAQLERSYPGANKEALQQMRREQTPITSAIMDFFRQGFSTRGSRTPTPSGAAESP